MKDKNFKKEFDTFKIFRELFRIIPRKRKSQLFIILLLMIGGGFAESLLLAAIIPFLTAITNPESLLSNKFINQIFLFLDLQNLIQLKFLITLIFIIAIIFSSSIRLINLWLHGRVAAAIGSDLSNQVYLRTLFQPYLTHISNNSASTVSAITQEIRYVIQCIRLSLNAICSIFISTSIITTLFILNFEIAIISSLFLSFSFGIFSLTVRKKLYFNSKKTSELYQKQIKVIQEGLGGIKDIILNGTQFFYSDIYRKVDRPMRIYQAKSNFLAEFPRYTIEGLGLILLGILSFLFTIKSNGNENLIPVLGAIALGAQRLIPALQQVYSCWANIKSNIFSIKNVLERIKQKLPKNYMKSPKKIKLQKGIKIKNISFKYDDYLILKNINFEIKKGDIIGIIGKTGSGKTSLINLLMGLLNPFEGEIFIDDKSLYRNTSYTFIASWRKHIAHVPQEIFLSDSSFAENIAFGIPRDKIDFKKVIKVAGYAQIHNFISTRESGYETIVGERGIKLSGGQKQRIGIARALYREPLLLILDEATSALDNATEKLVIESIYQSCQDIMIIMVAHRLSTLDKCSQILELKDGVSVSKRN